MLEMFTIRLTQDGDATAEL